MTFLRLLLIPKTSQQILLTSTVHSHNVSGVELLGFLRVISRVCNIPPNKYYRGN